MKIFDRIKEAKAKLDNYDNISNQLIDLKEELKKAKENFPHEVIHNLELAVEKRQHSLTEAQDKLDKVLQENSELKYKIQVLKHSPKGGPEWL